MGILHQNIPDELLKDFNKLAREKFGDKKGAKHSALVEAIGDWTKNNNKSSKVKK